MTDLESMKDKYHEERRSCSFCGWESGIPGWITLRERSHYGLGPSSEADHWLCQFCLNSYVVSAWMSGNTRAGSAENKDRLLIANMQLAAQGIEAIRTLMLTLAAHEL